MKEKRIISLNKTVQKASILLICLAIFEALLIIATLVGFLLNFPQGLLLSFFIVTGILTILIVVFLVSYLKRVRTLYFDDFYKTSLENYNHIASLDKEYKRYPEGQYQEFDNLNSSIGQIENNMRHAVVYSSDLDFEAYGVHYVDADKCVTDYETFVHSLNALIFASGVFRNALFSIRYNLKEEKINRKDSNYIIDKIKASFSGYGRLLIAPTKEEDGFYVFIPRFDSIASLKEGAEYFLRDSAISKKSQEKGIRLFSSKIAAVIYPYSGIDEMMNDLHYAERQGKTIYFYFPEKAGDLLNKKALQNSISLNSMNKVLEMFSSETELNLHEGYDEMMKVFERLRTYLNIDETGVIIYSVLDKSFKVRGLTNDKKGPHIFKQNDIIKEEFIHEVEKYVDSDNTHYFSRRETCADAIGRYMDIYGIKSGFLYLSKDTQGKTQGVIYFANKDRKLFLDTYLRESLLVFSSYVSTQIRNINNDYQVQTLERRMTNVMKMTNSAVYAIDRDTYELNFISDSVKDMFPFVQLKDKCHHAFYGKTTPCHKCPLKTGKKMLDAINFRNYEVSLTLNEKNDVNATLLIRENDVGYATDRFDPDILINTRYSLYDCMNNSWLTNQKGYILALKINNLESMIQTLQSEGMNEYLRNFSAGIIKLEGGKSNVYLYQNQVLCLVLPEAGRNGIIDITEKIYEISKSSVIKDNESIKAEISYVAMPFPSSFASAGDFINHIEKFLNEYKAEKNDYLFFEQTNYARYAGHTDFLLSVIEESFQNKSFNVRLQPMVDARSKRILGAEMLMRLTDTYRNTQINTDEAIRVAAQHDKIGLISNALSEYLGTYYEKWGFQVFKPKKFTRLAMNTDYSYFSDPAFVTNMGKLTNDYYLPDGFLSFELNERDLYNHFGEYLVLLKSSSVKEITLVCDQYTGQFLSIERLKQLGMKGLKISRSIVKDIDKDENAMKSVLNISEAAAKEGLDVVLVGLENQIQYDLVIEKGIDCRIQGYYFYQPLEALELINKIRDANID